MFRLIVGGLVVLTLFGAIFGETTVQSNAKVPQVLQDQGLPKLFGQLDEKIIKKYGDLISSCEPDKSMDTFAVRTGFMRDAHRKEDIERNPVLVYGFKHGGFIDAVSLNLHVLKINKGLNALGALKAVTYLLPKGFWDDFLIMESYKLGRKPTTYCASGWYDGRQIQIMIEQDTAHNKWTIQAREKEINGCQKKAPFGNVLPINHWNIDLHHLR